MKSTIKRRREHQARFRALKHEHLESRQMLAYADVILASNPVAYLKMDEGSGSTALDTSFNAGLQNGTYGGNPTLGQSGVLAEGGTSVRFDPAGGTDSVRLTTPITASFTYETWAKSPTATWSDLGILGSERAANGFIMHTNGSGGTSWTGYIVDGGGTFHAVGTHTPASITDWNHYAMSYDVATDTALM